MKAHAHLDVTEALAWIMVFFRVGLTGADLGSSFKEFPTEDSGRADWDRNKGASPGCKLSLVLHSIWNPDFTLVRSTSRCSLSGYFNVNRPVNRRHCCDSLVAWPCPPFNSLPLPSTLADSPARLPPFRHMAQCSNPTMVSGSVNAGWMLRTHQSHFSLFIKTQLRSVFPKETVFH